MRVIAGTKRRMNLQSVDGMDTRPTTDRIKETLFNIISDDIYDCRFLDIFAGSGQIGIEALSRGAAEVYFIEKAKKALSVIAYNIDKTGLNEHSHILSSDYNTALRSLAGKRFDIIFADPPYHAGYERSILEAVSENHILEHGGYLIIEADINTELDFIPECGYDIIKEKLYKTNKHIFLRETGNE